MQYVINKRSKVLHKLPASESCNTDDIASEYRFYLGAAETVVGYIGLPNMRYCKRCFPGSEYQGTGEYHHEYKGS
jgi:hypothetical protein